MKCLCKLEIIPVEINPACAWHGMVIQHLTAAEMSKEIVTAFQVERQDFMYTAVKHGRWRCPVCGQWCDKNAGWRPYLYGADPEDVCLTCYHRIQALQAICVGNQVKITDPLG